MQRSLLNGMRWPIRFGQIEPNALHNVPIPPTDDYM